MTAKKLHNHKDFLMYFTVELINREMQGTHNIQKFVDELKPWVIPSDLSVKPRPVFTILDDLAIDKDKETVEVSLSPEGKALFRAWVRRQGIDPDTIIETPSMWS